MVILPTFAFSCIVSLILEASHLLDEITKAQRHAEGHSIDKWELGFQSRRTGFKFYALIHCVIFYKKGGKGECPRQKD